MSYNNRPPVPQEVRRIVLQRNGGRCEDCGRGIHLELHHLRYHTVFDRYGVPIPALGRHPAPRGIGPIFGYETPDDLAALCRGCHYGRHIDIVGEFWRDPEDMNDYWTGFFSEMEKGSRREEE